MLMKTATQVPIGPAMATGSDMFDIGKNMFDEKVSAACDGEVLPYLALVTQLGKNNWRGTFAQILRRQRMGH